MVATSPLSAEKKRADHPVLCGDGGWRKRHTVYGTCSMYRGSTAFVNSCMTDCQPHSMIFDILLIGNSCGCFANWCVRTFIRTYVHVQKVWHLKQICKIKFMPGKKTGLTKPVPKALHAHEYVMSA